MGVSIRLWLSLSTINVELSTFKLHLYFKCGYDLFTFSENPIAKGRPIYHAYPREVSYLFKCGYHCPQLTSNCSLLNYTYISHWIACQIWRKSVQVIFHFPQLKCVQFGQNKIWSALRHRTYSFKKAINSKQRPPSAKLSSSLWLIVEIKRPLLNRLHDFLDLCPSQ